MLEKLFAKRHIQNLKLDSVRAKAVEKLGWSEEQASRVEHDYRRFLYALAHKHKDEMISPPNQEVDEFWHQHILDTRKYREDCDTIFGHYIDHTPGLSPSKQSQADARRRQIYRDYDIDNIDFELVNRPHSGGDSGSVDGGSGGFFTGHSHGTHGAHSSHGCDDAGAHGHGAEAGGHADGGHGGDSCDSGSGDGGGGDGGGSCGGGGGCGGGGCGGG